MKIILGFIFFVTQVGLFCPWSIVDGQQPKHTFGLTPSGEANTSVGLSNSEIGLQQVAAEHYGPSTMDHRPRPVVALHDYHISNFEIEWNAETKALEIIAKIFIDDLEDGIAASGVEEKLYLCTDREIETGDDHVYTYLTEKMKIRVNGDDRSYNYIGKEVSEDLVAMYCYLEVENVESVEEITITNDMLMELFDDQINIIKLKSKSTAQRGFMMLKKGEHSDTVNW